MQTTQNCQNDLEKEQVTEFILHDFKTYYKSIVINSERCWNKDRNSDQ